MPTQVREFFLSAMPLADFASVCLTPVTGTSPLSRTTLGARKDFHMLTQNLVPWNFYPLVVGLPTDTLGNTFFPAFLGQPFRCLETIQLFLEMFSLS